VGWSLGANILVNYVGEEGADCALTSAVSLCNPFNLPVCNAALQKGFSKVYDWSLGSKLASIFGCAGPMIPNPESDPYATGLAVRRAVGGCPNPHPYGAESLELREVADPCLYACAWR
jgi:hypothetical protein